MQIENEGSHKNVGILGETVVIDAFWQQALACERNDRIQIISARKATRHEQREYYGSQVDE
jgi:uncharacterized DUF497 family protein